MRRLLLLCCCALALVLAPRPSAAQTVEDSAAVLLRAAELLRAEGENAAADAVLRLLQRRYPGTRAGAEAERQIATLRLAPEPVRSGRVELLVFSTTYGLWLGTALPIMLDADSPEAYGLGLLTGAPLGFLSARAYLKNRPITEGQARAITFGGTWGSWQGFGWTQVLDIGVDNDCPADPTIPCYESEDPSGKALVAGTVVGGLAGIATGAALARKPISSGVATTVSFGGIWGSWFGFATGYLMDAEEDGLLSATLIGGDVGLVAMALLAPQWNPSRNRARLVSLGGLIGGLGGAGLDLIIQPDDEKVAMLIPTVTSALGLIVASRAARDFDRSSGGNGDADRDGGPGGALLDLRDGRLQVDVPAVRLRLDRTGGRQRSTSLYVPVLQARF